MAGCGPCPDSCNCLVADEFGVIYPGSGDAGSPIIVPRAVPETAFAATSTGATITATPGGTAGHAPNLEVAVCNILQESAERQNGRLVIFSDDADCKPERLRDPVANEYLGFDPGSGQATWLTLPTDFSLTIDPESTAPVSYGVNGLRVDCCPSEPQIVPFTAGGTFDSDDYPGMTAAKVRAVGGGGGSGGSAATGVGEAAAGGGGGSSAYAEAIIPIASLGAPVTVTVGAGGSAGAAGNNDGGNGGDTSFGALVIADGGSGGQGSALQSGTNNGGPGGAGGLVASSVGNIRIPGSQGGNGWVNADSRNFGAYGAASLLGAQVQAGTGAGVAGSLYGSGAAGSNNGASAGSKAGAAGSAGICIVEVIY